MSQWKKPNRAPDHEQFEEGPTPDAVKQLESDARHHYELFVDMGDPEHAPRGWWALRRWDRRPDDV